MPIWLVIALALGVTLLAAVVLVVWLRRRARRHAAAEGWVSPSAGSPASYRPHPWPSPPSAPERYRSGDSDELVLVPMPIIVDGSATAHAESPPAREFEPAGGGFGGAGASGSWDDDTKRVVSADVSAGMCDAEPVPESSWSDSGGSSEASYDSSSSDTGSSWDSNSSGSDFSSDP